MRNAKRAFESSSKSGLIVAVSKDTVSRTSPPPIVCVEGAFDDLFRIDPSDNNFPPSAFLGLDESDFVYVSEPRASKTKNRRFQS